MIGKPYWPIATNDANPQAALDATLFRAAPVHVVPANAPFEPVPAGEIGHRFLVARSGLWIECRRPWLHVLFPVGPLRRQGPPEFEVNLPFGDLARRVELFGGDTSHSVRDFVRDFIQRARTSAPDERGAWVSWEHDVDPRCPPRLVWSDPIDMVGTPGRLEYFRPETTPTHCACIDLHSHGHIAAFFSSIDNADDCHDVKIAIVVGSLDKPVPTVVARLCVLGIEIPIAMSAEEIVGGPAEC